jgi:peptidoglycan/xylan/chitin deacetylase (PgdA/CDA1 family)
LLQRGAQCRRDHGPSFSIEGEHTMIEAHQERLIVLFHGIGDPWPGVPEPEKPYWCPSALWPAMADAVAGLAAHADLPVHISFDDGNLSDYDQALPVLRDRGLTATFFVLAGRLSHPKYLSADHVRALREAGMGIGNHGWAHADLRRTTDSELAHEVDDSRRLLREVTGETIDSFAIPFGSYDRRVLRKLRSYRTVYTSDARRAQSSGWLVPRHTFTQGWTPDTVRHLATERYGVAQLARQRLVGAVKRLR